MVEECERNPEDFLRYKKEDHYMDAVAKVADFVGCRQENLLLVENSTSGLDGHLYNNFSKPNAALKRFN